MTDEELERKKELILCLSKSIWINGVQVTLSNRARINTKSSEIEIDGRQDA